MKLRQALAETLRAESVETLFGVMGDGNLYTVHSFVHDFGGRFVPATHEAGATLMALGYAAASNRVGIATVTHGPGLTNSLTALTEGVRRRTPIVLLAGDTAAADSQNIQNVDQREFVKATGAGYLHMATADPRLLTSAIRQAMTERRPVVLDVPADLQRHADAVPSRPRAALHPLADDVTPDPLALDRALGIIATAHRPIVLAGAGAISPGARAALVALADRLGAPLATTLLAKDLFRGEPFDLGIFGTLSHDLAVETISACDCIIAFGAGLNSLTTAAGVYVTGRRVVQIDTDPARLGALTDNDASVVGGASATATAMISWLDEAETGATAFRSPALAERLAAHHSPSDAEPRDPLTWPTVLQHIDRHFPSNRTLVNDGGRFIYQALKLLHVEHPSTYLHTVNFGSIGLSVATAIGAAIAQPARPTLVVCGDGGFMMGGLTELNTAVREGLDLTILICNDHAYGAEYVQLAANDIDTSLSHCDWPDLASVSRALGARATTVRSVAELISLRQLLGQRRNQPLVIDVQLDPAGIPNE